MRQNGVTIAEAPPQAVIMELQKAGTAVINEWSSKAGPDGVKALEAYRATKR